MTRKRFQKLLRSKGIFKDTAVKKIWCKNYAETWANLDHCIFTVKYNTKSWRESKRLELICRTDIVDIGDFAYDTQCSGIAAKETWYPLDKATIVDRFSYLTDKMIRI